MIAVVGLSVKLSEPLAVILGLSSVVICFLVASLILQWQGEKFIEKKAVLKHRLDEHRSH